MSGDFPGASLVVWIAAVRARDEPRARLGQLHRRLEGDDPRGGARGQAVRRPGYDRALVNAIYDERGKRDAGGGLAYFTSAPALPNRRR